MNIRKAIIFMGIFSMFLLNNSKAGDTPFGLAAGKHFIIATSSAYTNAVYKGGTFKVIPVEEGVTSFEVKYLSDLPRDNRGPFQFEVNKTNQYWESGLDGNLFFPNVPYRVVEVKSDKAVQIFLNQFGTYPGNGMVGYSVPSVDGRGKLFYAWVFTSQYTPKEKKEGHANLRIMALQGNTTITIRGQEDKRAEGALKDKEERVIKADTNRFFEINYGCASGFREIRADKPILVYITPCSYNHYTMLLPTYEAGIEKYVGREFYGGTSPFPNGTTYPGLVITCLEDDARVYVEYLNEDGSVVKKTDIDKILKKGEEYIFALKGGASWYHVVSTKNIYVYTSQDHGYTRDSVFLPDINGVFRGSEFIFKDSAQVICCSAKPDNALVLQSFDKKFSPFTINLSHGFSWLGSPTLNALLNLYPSEPALCQMVCDYSMTYAMPLDSPLASAYLPANLLAKPDPVPVLANPSQKADNPYKELSVADKLARFKKEYLISKKPVKIVGFGDSVTFSARKPGAETYYAILANQLRGQYGYSDITVVNAGTGGNNTFHALSRIREDVVKTDPQLILVMFGVNDSWRGINLDIYQRNLKEIMQVLENETRALIIMLGPTISKDNHPDVMAYNEVVEKMSGTMQFPYVSMGRLMLDHQAEFEKLYTDPQHPGPEGHKLMGEALGKYLTGGK